MATRILLLCILVWMPGSCIFADGYFFALDTPAVLNGVNYSSHEILQRLDNNYLSLVAIPEIKQIGALHRQADGSWLLSPSHPVELNGVIYEARDIVAYDGSVYSPYFDGSTAGIPPDARIDALYIEAGRMYFSLDIPVFLDLVEYSASDLIHYNGNNFSLMWDAESAGVPAGANLTGADITPGGQIVVSFDVPVTLGGTLFLPGELIVWNGSTFTSYSMDPAFYPQARVSDFSFAPASGGVSASGAVPLTVTKAANGHLTLSWSPSCSGGDVDYEVYAGTIGSYYSHTAFLCTTGGATSVTITPNPEHTYYLVVPTNLVAEGSYGESSAGMQRPQGNAACRIQSVAACGI